MKNKIDLSMEALVRRQDEANEGIPSTHNTSPAGADEFEEVLPLDIRVPDVGDMIPAPVIDLFGRRVKSEEKSYIEAEVYELLLEMSRQGVSLRCSRQTEDRLVASPRNALSAELIEGIKEHKTQIIQAMQDHELLKSGVVQCERQAFELAREEFKGAS